MNKLGANGIAYFACVLMCTLATPRRRCLCQCLGNQWKEDGPGRLSSSPRGRGGRSIGQRAERSRNCSRLLLRPR